MKAKGENFHYGIFIEFSVQYWSIVEEEEDGGCRWSPQYVRFETYIDGSWVDMLILFTYMSFDCIFFPVITLIHNDVWCFPKFNPRFKNLWLVPLPLFDWYSEKSVFCSLDKNLHLFAKCKWEGWSLLLLLPLIGIFCGAPTPAAEQRIYVCKLRLLSSEIQNGL